MGIDCKIKDLEKIWSLYNCYPIITTLKVGTIVDKFKDYNYISLGELLSSALLKYKKMNRKDYVINESEKIFNNINSNNLIIDNIDMLFNPEYGLDILGYFIQIARNRRLIILWPGEYSSGSLTYAASEHEDYKKYLIRDYDVICLR